MGNCRYTETDATFKLEVSAISEDGEVLTAEAQAFRRNASLYGLEPDDLGMEFSSRGEAFTLIGLRPRSRKYPMVGRRSDGKVFKFSEEAMVRHKKFSGVGQ